MNRLPSLRALGVAILVTVVSVVQGAQPAHATYFFKPGHPMNERPGTHVYCTGGWAVRIQNQPAFFTAGHCFALDQIVYGTDSEMGRVVRNAIVRNDDGSAMDALVMRPRSGVDAYQIVAGVEMPTIGKHDNSYFRVGNAVHKIGRTTGLTSGEVVGIFTWRNDERIVCTDYWSEGGDSGGPVFTNDSRGRATAAGMHVGRLVNRDTGKSVGCFLTIEDMLNVFGATLPVFPSSTKQPLLVGPSSSTAMPLNLPKLTGDWIRVPD